ncbi:MAG: hypothetical protein K2G69_01200 [Muribaculaceae bacterium]|nr:hypothetical protein [Muribaculaceae bacterium]
MKSTSIYKSLLALAAPCLLAACSSDANEPTPIVEENEGIVLNIPTVELTRTRATEGGTEVPSDTEATIKSLTVFAFPQNNKGTKAVYTMSSSELNSINIAKNGYKPVPVKLKAGQYHIYVVANLSYSQLTYPAMGSTAVSSFDDVTETGLQNASLNSTISAPGTIPSTGIPMSADYDVLKPSANGSAFTNGLVEIKSGESTSVYADLTFCMAKLRFTMLNGNTPDIEMAEINPVQLVDYPTTIGLMKDVASLAAGSNSLTISSSAKPLSGKLYKYPVTGNTADKDWTVTDLTTDKPADSKQWAWQGTWYIPEHIFASGKDAKKSSLKIGFNIPTTDRTLEIGKDNKVERSNVYDVLGYIQKKEVVLEVRVKAWTYHKNVYDLDEEGNVTPAN